MRVPVGDEAEAAEAIRQAPRALPVCGGSKPALSGAEEGTTAIDVSALRGVVDYDPAELTFTARAGTPLAELEALLASHRQCLAFDPPLAAAGATIGGAVAAATSGPGAFGAGGVRDFVIGIRVLDGEGRCFRGGGRVVKNAAGFDLPKLMVGSAGRLGLITEVSCKVFPLPEGSATLAFELGSLPRALAALAALARGAVHLDALELEPPGRLIVRICGAEAELDERVARLAKAVDGPIERLSAAAAAELWKRRAELGWAAEGSLVARIPITIDDVPALDGELERAGAARIYSLGANLAWVAVPGESAAELDRLLAGLGLAGAPLRGPARKPSLGRDRSGGAFGKRIRRAMDPAGRFGGAP
jgi:glycolate oxidase FAD binding subunit